MKYSRIPFFLLVGLAITGAALAQDRKQLPRDEQNQYVVSAKAGVVNLVDGEATVRRHKPFAMPQVLISGDDLEKGDVVKTVASGRAEILLNPGCYLRLGESSEFVFLFDNLYNQNQVKLLRGSMIIESSVSDLPILVAAPGGDFTIIKSGLYRFNVAADGGTQVAVRKGRLLIGQIAIKEGKLASLNGGLPVLVSFNKNEVDDLDDWSKDRAKTLIAANRNLSNRAMKRSLSLGVRHNTWIYDGFYMCYTFLPIGSGFSSPYGWGYSVYNPYWYAIPWWRRNNGGWSGGGGNAGGQPSGGGNAGGGGSGGGHPAPPPMPMDSPRLGPPSHGSGPDRDAPAPIHGGGRRP
jgi:FecR protein